MAKKPDPKEDKKPEPKVAEKAKPVEIPARPYPASPEEEWA